jgi:hypothetical protein
VKKWSYTIQWIGGELTSYTSSRFSHVTNGTLTIYVNEHGHDGRFDEVHVNLGATMTVKVEEIR